MKYKSVLSKLFLAIPIVLFVIGVRSYQPLRAAPVTPSVPSVFIENVGQLDDRVRFQVRGSDRTFWLTEDGIWISIIEHVSREANGWENRGGISSDLKIETGAVIKLSFPDANPHPRLEPFDRLETQVSSFVGNDPELWYTDVPTWSGVRYVDIYPSVDLEITSENGQLVQRLIVQNDEASLRLSSPTSYSYLDTVRLRIDGANKLILDRDCLILSTTLGNFSLPLLEVTSADGVSLDLPTTKPAINGTDIISPFSHSPINHSFSIPTYDTAKLLHSTFLGGGDDDFGSSIALDTTGNTVVTGWTTSSSFPTTPGAFDLSRNGGSRDIFVSKLTADGSSLLYSTFVGGDSDDRGKALILDTAGNAVVTGVTYSPDFPTTAGASDTTHNGRGDIFILKLSADGSSLLYSTFVGGSSDDSASSLILDSAGNVVVTGGTASSSDFPTVGAYDNTFNGAVVDAFVLKLAADGSTLLYSTFLGGNHDEAGFAVALDSEGNIVVAGRTNSSDFPTTEQAFDTTFNGCDGCYDVFILKLTGDGASLHYSTYVGGSRDEDGLSSSLGMDSAGNIIFTGRTNSSDFPTTVNAYDVTHNGYLDVFVLKLAADGGSLLYSTYLGGSGNETGLSLALDDASNILVTGLTDSSDFPTTVGAYDTTYNGSEDAFVFELAANGDSLSYSTYIGGTGFDSGTSLALDAFGNVVFTGRTESSNFPTTIGAYDNTYNVGSDAFVAKLGATNTAPTVTVDQPTVSVDEGQTATNTGMVSDPDNDLVTLSVSVGTVSNNYDGTWSWSFATNDGPSESQSLTIIADDGNGGTAQITFDLIVNNVAPLVDPPTIIPEPSDEGSAVTVNVIFSDPGIYDAPFNCTVNYGDGSGNQSGIVSGNTCSGPAYIYDDNAPYSVTISMIDKDSSPGISAPVTHVVNNVAPTASFTNTSEDVLQGETASLVFSDQFDPSGADRVAGFLYSYDCTNDGVFELSDVFQSSYDCVYPESGIFIARGRIQDKDEGFTDYTVEVIVLTPAEAIQNLIDTVEELNLQHGIDNSLDAKLESAQKALEDLNENNDVAAINSLEAFINAAEAQRGKALTTEQADMLIEMAQRIIDSIS